MRLLSLLLPLLMGTQATYPTPGPGRQVHSCTAPTMTYRWTPTAGCSTSTPCATDQVSGNNASQATLGKLPTYGATCGPNSLPCLTFNGTSDYINPTTPIPSGLTAFTFYAIIEITTGSKFNPILGGVGNSIRWDSDNTDTMLLTEQDVISVPGLPTLTTNTWYTVVVSYLNSTTTTTFYHASGGTLHTDSSNSTQPLAFSATTPDLGAAHGDSVFFTGNIAEWGYVNSVSTAGIANWSSCHYGV